MQGVARGLYRLFVERRGGTTALRAYLKDRGLSVGDLPDAPRRINRAADRAADRAP